MTEPGGIKALRSNHVVLVAIILLSCANLFNGIVGRGHLYFFSFPFSNLEHSVEEVELELITFSDDVDTVVELDSGLPPCKVLVQNTVWWHYEVLESVAKLFPLQYLQFKDASACNSSVIAFDFAVLKLNPDGRANGWIEYYKENLKKTSISTRDGTLQVERRIGAHLQVIHVSKASYAKRVEHGLGIPINETGFDAVIETSCYCEKPLLQLGSRSLEWLLNETKQPYRSCIFHEKCMDLQDHPRAVWVSPHFQQHFIPHALPQPSQSQSKDLFNSDPTNKQQYIDICCIGAWERRSWDLLVEFFTSDKGKQVANQIRINLLGAKGFPPALEPYQLDVLIQEFNPSSDSFFHELESQCDIVTLLITKEKNPDYFLSAPDSKYKLSGTIPPIIAYNKSFVLPDEIVSLYKDHLPMQLPHAKFDSQISLNQGLFSVVNQLLATRNTSSGASTGQTSAAQSDQPTSTNEASCAKLQFIRSGMAFCNLMVNGGKNFGDELGPVVMAQIAKNRFNCTGSTSHLLVKNRRLDKSPAECLWSVGSVFHFTTDGDHVWGTGVRNAKQPKTFPKKLSIYGVRGSNSVERLQSQRILRDEVPISLGDPGFLIPYIFPEYANGEGRAVDRNRSSTHCFIPHYKDFSIVDTLTNASGITFITPAAAWEDVISKILHCDFVASTSLHGVILADAFGIPGMWFQFPGSLVAEEEGTFKYLDYFSSLGKAGEDMGRPLKPVGDFALTLDEHAYPKAMEEGARRAYASRMLETFPVHLFKMDMIRSKL